MRRALGATALALGTAALVVGCGGGGDSNPNPSPLVLDKEPSASGDAQTAPVSTALSNDIRVLVTRDGSPQSGVTVTWSTTNGTLAPTSGPTDPSGIAASRWTLGPNIGAQTAQAAVTGANGSPVTFTATATGGGPPPPPPLVVAKAPTDNGDTQTGPVGQPLPNDLRIIVTRDGIPESDITVNWTTANGTLSPTSGPTDGAGIAASTWTLGPNGGVLTAQAAVAGANGSPVTFTATATGGPPAPDAVAIRVGNIFFQSERNGTTNPAVDTLAVNGTATWTWVNTSPTSHTVQSTGSPSFTSSTPPQSANGTTYEFQFSQAGTYTYNCQVHGSDMTGRIVVK
jgi:plastocyanin